jgi:hypothetical protein
MVEGYAVVMAGTELRVAPDPFGGRRLPFRIPCRRIPRRRYESDADLHAVLQSASEEVLEGTAVGCDDADGRIASAPRS